MYEIYFKGNYTLKKHVSKASNPISVNDTDIDVYSCWHKDVSGWKRYIWSLIRDKHLSIFNVNQQRIEEDQAFGYATVQLSRSEQIININLNHN